MIYLDYAATSYKKPKCVYKAVWDALIYHSANPGRGGHTPSVRAGEIIYEKNCHDCFTIIILSKLLFFPIQRWH